MEMFSTFEERRVLIVERLVFSLKPYQTVYRGMFYRKTHIQEILNFWPKSWVKTLCENANFSSFLRWPFYSRERPFLYLTCYQTISPGQEPIGSCSWVILWETTHVINLKFFTKRNDLNFWPKSKMPIFLFFWCLFHTWERLVLCLTYYQTISPDLFYGKLHMQ